MLPELEIIFTKGLPGSGKSTWSLKHCTNNLHWIRVNRDDIRASSGRYWVPEREDYITTVEKFMVETALLKGYNVVVDAMNINEKYMLAWNKWVIEFMANYNVSIKVSEKSFLDTPLKTCIERDAMRSKERRVGAKLIKEQYYKHVADVRPVEKIFGLPHTIIVDIDGTIAQNVSRGHYEYEKVNEDLPKKPIIDLVRTYLKLDNIHVKEVIFISGRDNSCEKATKEWIEKYLYLEAEKIKLFMRKTGDYREDNIVKRELFEDHIRGKYNIDFVLDDRDRVVSMWRNELGLTCLQVADGDF